MSLLRTIGTKSINLSGLQVDLTVTLEQDDQSGQIFTRVIGNIGEDFYEHKDSIGSIDGNDALVSMTNIEVAQSIQASIDAVRQVVAKKLVTRAKIRASLATLT